MSNILAIAQKELKSYFASPIAYIVLGLFAFVYGYFYAVMFSYFMQMSMRGAMGGAPPMNVNQDMLRPIVQNMLVVLLFVMPLITMRTYSEEKRSGTIELLLTAPLTDFQIIMGKFLGAMGLFCAMLAVTFGVGVNLFLHGNPQTAATPGGVLLVSVLGVC